jgi:hypothetical protein
MNFYVLLSFTILQKLQALDILSESLKQQDLEFREQCKSELVKLQKMVKYNCCTLYALHENISIHLLLPSVHLQFVAGMFLKQNSAALKL